MEIVRQLQISLAEQFDRTFSRTYNELNAELAARDARIREVEGKAKLAEQARREASLRIENLQRQILVLQDDLGGQQIDPEERSASAVRSSDLQEAYDPEQILTAINNDDSNTSSAKLLQIYHSLGAKYRSLYTQVQELATTSDTLRTKVKRAKEKLSLWQECFTREEFTVPVSGAIVTFKRIEQAAGHVRKSQTFSLSPPQPISALGTSKTDVSNPGSTLHDQRIGSPLLPPRNIVRPDSQVKLESDRDQVDLSTIQQSDPVSTQSQDSSVSQEYPRDDSFNNPAVAAARSFKRKWQLVQEQAPPNLPCQDAVRIRSSARPVVMKCEQTSSSPLRITSHYLESRPHGTEDLDDVGSTVVTPRKHAPGDVIGRSDTGFQVFDDSMPDNLDMDCDQQVQTVRKKMGPPTALQPVDTNRRAARRCEPGSDSKRRKTSGRGEQAIPAVAEDGDEDYVGARIAKGLKRLKNTSETEGRRSISASLSVNRRLNDLLEAASPRKSPLIPHKTPKTSSITLQGWLGSPVDERYERPVSRCDLEPPSRIGTHDSSQRNQRPRTLHRPGPPGRPYAENFNNDLTAMDPEDEPYRTRPVHRLNLDCFKINTEYNEGLDFAFDEVVRKKDQRKCLPGCTRPDCCGDRFRAMARAGGLMTVPMSALNGSNSEDDQDRQILEDYLGDQKHMLDTMSDKKRQDILIDAKARLLANQYGKHRHAHERARSPPGFWRTEMPDTQEVEQDREEARKLEREKVIERYKEAMRAGGLWRFADEC